MTYSNYIFEDHIGVKIFVHKWIPDDTPKAMVYIAHGMGVHALRYGFFAEELNKNGYVVYADDHRGHGKTIVDGKMGVLHEDGWNGTVKDIKQIIDQMKKDYPNLPLFIFGHSWGSFLTQEYMQLYPGESNGIILSGSTGKQGMLGPLIFIGKRIVKKHGADSEADFIYKLAIEPLSKPFLAEGSSNAWISTIKEEVQKYDDDPLCGFKPTNGYFLEMGLAMKRMWAKKSEAKISKDTPLFIVSGSEDVVSERCKNLYPLIERYKKIGIKDVTYKIYDGARHEPLNDISRAVFVNDCIQWLDGHL